VPVKNESEVLISASQPYSQAISEH